VQRRNSHCGAMVRPLLARSGLQVLGRATGSPRRWVGAPRAPAAAGEHGGEWRRISSGGVRQGGGAQQQAGGPRAEPFCSADSAAATPAGGAGSLAAFCSRALNGAAPHKTSGAGRAANEHASNGQANGVNGVSHVHSMPNLGGSITDAVAPEHHNEHHAHVDPRQRAREVILGGAATLQRLAATVDETFDQAVALIEGRGKGSRVIVVGIGKSGHLARKMSATLSSTGTPISAPLCPSFEQPPPRPATLHPCGAGPLEDVCCRHVMVHSDTGTASFFMHGTEALHGDLGGAQVLSV
jgi:hypothetical protein